MRDLAENRLDVYRCHTCAAMNVAAESDWCLCTGVERTLMCSKCGHCFCDAPSAWKRDFWRDASKVLLELLEKPINAGMFRAVVEKMINVKLPAVPERQERCLVGVL